MTQLRYTSARTTFGIWAHFSPEKKDLEEKPSKWLQKLLVPLCYGYSQWGQCDGWLPWRLAVWRPSVSVREAGKAGGAEVAKGIRRSEQALLTWAQRQRRQIHSQQSPFSSCSRSGLLKHFIQNHKRMILVVHLSQGRLQPAGGSVVCVFAGWPQAFKDSKKKKKKKKKTS